MEMNVVAQCKASAIQYRLLYSLCKEIKQFAPSVLHSYVFDILR